MDYLLKGVEDSFYKKIKQLALDQNRTIKGLILNLLEEEINKKKEGVSNNDA